MINGDEHVPMVCPKCGFTWVQKALAAEQKNQILTAALIKIKDANADENYDYDTRISVMEQTHNIAKEALL